MEKAFPLLAALYVTFHFLQMGPAWQVTAFLLAIVCGVAVAFQLVRRGMRGMIWRLRNRLIVTYLFIAVVPIFLILTLAWATGSFVLGQVAIYLADNELNRAINSLVFPVQVLTHTPNPGFGGAPGRGPRMGLSGPPPQGGRGQRNGQPQSQEAMVSRFIPNIQRNFPVFQLLLSGDEEYRYPVGAKIAHPPAGWKGDRGLMLMSDGSARHLYAWAHIRGKDTEVTVIAPIDHALLNKLVPNFGDVDIFPYTNGGSQNRIPARANALDFEISSGRPAEVPSWDSAPIEKQPFLVVNSRASVVLGVIFGRGMDFGETMLGVFVGIASLFLLVEIVSLWAGIKLTRTMTGAVHEIYAGTQHVKDGDFSYRIPVNGSDQLAEMGAAFNTMTSNLGRLIVVAKEKERLESELTIAREVQNQLFPRDVPFTKSLELKGVCNPARMVSGDYYDFVALSDNALAFAIGDVAGKGISAALLMATIQSTMRTQLNSASGNGHPRNSTACMVSNLNKQLYDNTSPEKYATFYFAMYDEPTHMLTYTNAGHLAPMLLRDGKMRMLDSTGTVVGAFPFAVYEEKTIALEHGDILVAYTDGIIEPENAYGEMFGEDRLMDLIVKYAHADSSEMIAHTMEAVNQWTGSSELQDDMTMVVARRI